MPAAANLLKTIAAGDTAPSAPPGPGGENFAAILTGEGEVTPVPAAAEDIAEGTDEATILVAPECAATLLPLVDQQRAVLPTATITLQAATDDAAITGTAGAIATASVLGASITSSIVRSEAGAGLPVLPGTASGRAPAAPATATDQIPATPTSIPAGEVNSVGRPPAVDIAANVKAIDAGPGKLAETEPPQATTPSMQAAAPPANSPSAQPAANDQQPGKDQQQGEPSAPTVEVRVQQPSSFSLTDARSLIASLTNSTAPGATTAPQQGVGEALAAQVLDLAGGGEWLDQITQEIGRATAGSGPLRFRLTPESLGELKVEISQSDRGAVVRMSVSTEAAQAALMDAQPRLVAEARAQGVRIADSQVDLAGSQQQGRESARQQASTTDQPLRAFRATASTKTQTEPSESRPADRYA